MITFLPAEPHVARGCDGRLRRIWRRTTWTGALEDAFLLALAETCNVHRAAERAGIPKMTAYYRRRTSAVFAARWHAALEIGHARMREALIRADVAEIERAEAAAAAFPDNFNPDIPIPPMTAEQALRQLKLHRWSVGRGGKRPGPRRGPRPKPMAEVAEGIQRKIAAIIRLRDTNSRAAAPNPPGPRDE
jgi:hypothetical protein